MMNDETEQFERRLSRQPLRQLPSEWRAEILAAAHGVGPPRGGVRGQRSALSLSKWFVNLLWPHPVAWAGLAAAWICILAVNVSIRDRSPVVAEKVSPPSPEVIAELRRQQKMLAELIGSTDVRVADRQPFFVPKPRSERVEMMAA